MTISPLVVGTTAAVVTGIGVGISANRITRNIADSAPTGSAADSPMSRIVTGAVGLGFVAAAGGMLALARGRTSLGAGLLGGGIGGMVGGFGTGLATTNRYGIGIDTSLQRVLDGYDANRNGQLELSDRSWFEPAETIRSHTHSTEDSDGERGWDTDYYSIERLAARADRDQDSIATRDELRAAIAAYDDNRDGRLQGDELGRFDREVGERRTG